MRNNMQCCNARVFTIALGSALVSCGADMELMIKSNLSFTEWPGLSAQEFMCFMLSINSRKVATEEQIAPLQGEKNWKETPF